MAEIIKYLSEAGTQALITEMKARLATKAVQYSTMPAAAVGHLGQIVQYIGTTGTYTQGGFYICSAVADSDPTEYEWVKLIYSKSEVDDIVSAAGHFEAVETLPTVDIKTNVIYLVPKTAVIHAYKTDQSGSNTSYAPTDDGSVDIYDITGATSIYSKVSTIPAGDTADQIIALIDDGTYTAVDITAYAGQTQNARDEYINLDGTSAGWEKIGDTEIDLSEYVRYDSMTAITAAELTAMWDD